MKEAFVFEVGKCYEHNTGKRIHIVAEAELDIYFSPCLIAETDSGSIIPVGKSEENAVNYHEITREEWLNTFKSSFVSEVKAEYGNGWIPVEKALPEDCDNRFYMCIVENHEEELPMYCQYNEDYGFGFWHDYYDEHTLGFVDSEFKTNEELGYEKVVAWMQIPKYTPTTD